MPKKDILAKLQALKASASSVSPSVTGMPNPEATDYFGNMLEGKVPFTLPKATEWPTDNEREGINKSISNIRDQVVAEPRTASDLTEISNPGELTFGRSGRRSSFGPVEPKNPADAGRPVFGPKPTSNMAMAIDQTLREAETLTNSSTEQHDGNSGLIDGFDYADTFTAGGLKAARKNAQAVATKTIEKKVRSGLPLSKEEQLFVDALGLRAKADAMVSSEGGNTISYQTGNVIGQMPEFIAQIVGTAPIGGEVGTAIKGIPLIAKGLKSTAPLWRKGVTLAGIELGKASVVSPLQPMFASNFADQELKQYRIERDESGNVTAERSNPQSVGTSLAKAFAQTLTENWSEGMGEVFGKAGAKIAQGVAKSKLGIRMAGSQLGSTIAKADELIGKATGAIGATADDFGLGGVKAFTRDMMKWNGTLEEIAEEEFNNVVQPLLMGEPEQLKQLLDTDQQLVTALSCAIAGVGFRALEIPGYVRSGVAINQNKNAYQQNLASISPDVAEQVVAAFAEQDIDARGKALSSLPWAEMHPAERESVVSAVWHRTRYDFLRGAKAASDAEQQLGHIKSKTDALIFKGRESRPTDGGSIYTAMLPNGSMGILVDGDILSEDQEGIEKHYAIPGARKPIVLTEDGRRIMVDHSELSSITRTPSSDIVSTSIDQWMEQQDVQEEQQDMEDADADMQAASLTPALPDVQEEEAPVSSPQPQAQVQPMLPAYTPKVGDIVQAPDGIVGKVVQSTPDGSVVAFVDHQGNEQIEVYGHNDGLQQYEGLAPTEEQPAQEELTLPEAYTNGAEQPAEPMPAGIAEAELPSASVEAPAAANPEYTEPLPTVDAVDSEAAAPSIAEGIQTLEGNPDIQQAMSAIETDAEVTPPSSRGQEDGAVPRSFPELAKEIGSTVNDEPSMEAPHYVSRNRNVFYTVNGGELLIMDRNGTEVPRQQGGRVNPKYTRLAKEYKEVFDYRRGDRGTAEGATSEEEALSMIIGSSKNPLELATIYLGEMARGNELVRDAETSVTGIILSIAQSSRVSQSGFAEWADPNFVTMTIAKTYFSKNGVNPSDIAALVNAELSGEWNATDMVTADDVVQAMLAYPRGAEDFSRQLRESTLAREAARAFASLTGFDITPSVADKVRTMQLDSTPKVASTQELEQQMADDHWEHFISVAERIGIDIGDDLNAAFSPESLQQINETNVEQDLEKPSQNNDLQATERTEGNAARGAASSSDSNISNDAGSPIQQHVEEAGDFSTGGEATDSSNAGEGPKDEPQRPNENSDSGRAGISLTPTQQAQYDKRKGELEREIATLTQQLVDARKAKDRAISEAQMRNGLFGDTASDPRQATIDGGGSLDVLSGVNTITQKHNETISHISRAISNKKRELEGLRNAVMGQAELFGEQPAASEDVPSEPKEQLDVQNHTTNTPDASVEEEEAKLDVQKHTTKIEDFGEKLDGARKDMMQKAKDAVSTITDERIISEPLSKVLPVVDLKAMVDAGVMTEKEAGLLQYMRSEIGVKPQKRYKMAFYLESVKAYVKLLDMITSRDSIPNPDLATFIVENKKEQLGDWSADQLAMSITYNSFLIGVPGATLFEVKQFANHNGYAITKGSIIVANGFPTIEEAAAAVRAYCEKKAENRKDVAFKFYQDTATKDIFIGWKGATGVVRLQEGFANVKEAQAYINEHEAELVEKLESIKDIPDERRASNTDRIGKSYRDGGNVTPDQFSEAFGFRGVQFGNWVEGDRRQDSLNNAYDALMDMANVLGLPPKAISLGGKLGLAFGSRGRGGKRAPSAHYEPDTMVINLTKENGAGSLAHEWWHALDNYFGKINKSTGGFATVDPYKKKGSDLRQAMSDVFRELRTAIQTSKLKSRSEKLDKARSKAYWSTNVEMSARAFEVYVVDRLAAQETSNDYLANLKSLGEWMQDRPELDDYPYPTEEEAKKINAAFDKLIGTIEHRTEDDGSVVMFSRTKALPETITVDGVERPTNNSEGNTIHTSVEGITNFWRWFGDSKVVDKQGRPLVVYHATQFDFDNFDKNKQGSSIDFGTLGSGFYFVTDSVVVNNYSRNMHENTRIYEGDNIIPAYLRIIKPYKASKVRDVSGDSKKESSKYSDKLIKKGYDGVEVDAYPRHNFFGDVKFYNVFESNQIKSAIGNNGNFSPTDDRITYSKNKISKVSEAVKEAKDTVAALYDSIAETSDSISSQYSVMQHLDGTAEQALIEAVTPLAMQWSEADSQRQDALGVLVQSRRISSDLPLLVDELNSTARPENGWNVESAQAFLDQMKAKYPTTNEATAVKDNAAAAELMRFLGYSEELCSEVEQEHWDGLTLPDGRVLINTANPNLNIAVTWAHEQGHSLMGRIVSEKDRMSIGEAVCNAIGVHDILAYIGNEYASAPIWMIGEEYLMHRIGGTVGGEPITALPATVAQVMEARNGVTQEQVEQIISTLVAQILKDSSNGKGESRRNGNDRDLFPNYQDPLHQNGNEGGVRGVPQADRGGNEPVRGIQQGWENEHHQDRVASAEEQTNTSPSEAQKRAGNYRKGKARILGMEISIENPEGSTRSGVDPNGKAWSITMPQPYGYILGTVGKDKDHIDVYLGRNLTKDTPVFIINQVNPSTGKLDEHKVMLGYPSYGAAKRAYMAAYEDGWKGFGSMGQMSLDEFKEWAYSGNTRREVAASDPAEELGDSQEFYNAWHDDDALGLPSDFDSAIAYARRGGVRAPERGMSTLEGRMDKLREQVQDATLRVRRLQEHIAQDGGRVPFAANAWEALNRYTSAAKAKMDYFESGELKNLITVAGEICKQVDATWEQLNDYLISKHGIDRQEVGEVMVFSTSSASEWTLENAKRTVADFEQKADAASLDRLWDAVKAATSASLNVLLEGGVVSQKDVDDYQSRKGWERYVPLRDFDASSELRADDVFEYSESRNPQRGTFVKATQTAKGRTSKPNSPIPQIAAMFASSVALAEKNRAKQALLNLVRLNPQREEYTVTRSWYVLDKGTNTTLEVFEKPKPSLLDLQSACIDFFTAPDVQAKNAMVQQLQDLQQAAIDDGADPNLVGLVMRQGMQDGATTITTKPHKSSILGETKEQDRQHMVAVFEDGVKYTVWFEDPELAAAVNHTNINTKFSETWFGSTMAAMNRWLSVNFTGKNPAFIPINWIRDVQYATLSHLIRHDGEAARTYANIGRATTAIHRYNSGSATPLTASELAGYSLHNPSHLLHLISSYGKGRVVDTLFEQYRKNGGETGYIHTDDIRAWAKRLRRHLQRELGTNPTIDKLGQAGSKYTGMHAAGRLLDYTAYQSENMVRFATFLASWEQGKGFAEAASDAKNVTVNFNRKGRLSGILNSLMVFFNATVQGTDNLLDRVILPNKGRFAAAASILFAASILAASMAIAAYGDGDDNPYWRMPEFVRYNSLVVPTYGIGGKERFLIIPLPPGLRFLNGWAVAALEGYHGQKNAAEVGSTMASSVIDNTSPIGIKGSDLTRTFIPSIAVPFYDIATNKDYAGRPVYREMFTQELRDNTPNSQQGSRDVNEAFSWFAGWLNELGGGNESVPAGTDRTTGKVSRIKRMLLDINPSKLEHVLSYFAGGRGQFFLDCYKTARPSWDESAELETRNIPVVKRLWGGASPSSDAKAFYERVDNLKRYQYYIDKSFKDGDRSGIKESLVRMDVYRWSQMAETYTEQVQELSRMADSKGVSKEQRQTMLDRRRLLMRQFLNNTKQYDKQPENIAAK